MLKPRHKMYVCGDAMLNKSIFIKIVQLMPDELRSRPNALHQTLISAIFKAKTAITGVLQNTRLHKIL
jgi:hypothetical protein